MLTTLTGDNAILNVGLKSRCPRCGQGRLFDGFLTLVPRCEVCGLDYSVADPADGPAFFIMITMAIPATAFGVWIEMTSEPPLWGAFDNDAAVLTPVLRANFAPFQRCFDRKSIHKQSRGGSL
jgi:uncharacterized protein (DUF983 family)